MVACSGDLPTATPVDAAADAPPPDDAAALDAADEGRGPGVDAGTLGAACRADADCAAGLSCWSAATQGTFWPQHFPALGMCTAHCSTDSACKALSPSAKCDPSSHACFEGCTFGGALGTFDPAKCHGRAELACNLGNPALCAPSCNADEDCPKGAGCEGLQGTCGVNVGPSNFAAVIGHNADAAAGCGSGFALNVFRPDAGRFIYCTAVCTVGAPRSCGWDGKTLPAPTMCVPVPGHPETSAGDLGECARLCECDADCDGLLSCVPLDPALAAKAGHRGACADAIKFPDAGTLACATDAGPG